MPQVVCPKCRSRFSVTEGYLGRKVRCRACEQIFTAAADTDGVVDVAPAEEPEAVAVSAAPLPRRRRLEEDEREPAPERRVPVQKKSPVLWILLGVGLLLLLPCCGVGGLGALWTWHRKAVPANAQADRADAQPMQEEMQAFNPPKPVEGKRANPLPQNVVVKPFTQRLPLDSKDTEVRDILFAKADAKQVAVYSHIESRVHRVDRYDLGTMRKIAGFELNDAKLIGDRKSLSPDGTVFAYEDGKDHVVVCSAVNGRQVARWKPYPRMGKAEPGASAYESALARFELITEDRLLTIDQAGGLDLWSLPDWQPVYHTKALTKGPFFNAQWGLAITSDRKTVAVFNGEGFNFMDTAKGQLVSKTGPLPDNPTIRNVWGTSFSDDGGQIVAAFTAKPANGLDQILLASFNVKTGQTSGSMPIGSLPVGNAPNPMYWGPKHLFVVGMGARNGGYVLQWPSGKSVRHLEAGLNNQVGFVARSDVANRLWYAAALTDFGTAHLVAVDVPEEELRAGQEKPDPALRLTAEGIIKKP